MPVAESSPSLGSNFATEVGGLIGHDSSYEIIDGEILELPTMSVYAQWLSARLVRELVLFVEREGLGAVVHEMLFVVDSVRGRSRRPDVAYVSRERLANADIASFDNSWKIVPELAIEIISPTDFLEDVFAKKREYFNAGVRQVWLVIPGDESVIVFSANDSGVLVNRDGVIEGGDVLPGLRLPVAVLFDRAL